LLVIESVDKEAISRPLKAARSSPSIISDPTRKGGATGAMFGRFKHWRRAHARYDRCADTFFSGPHVFLGDLQ
jgi:hypothetical protein